MIKWIENRYRKWKIKRIEKRMTRIVMEEVKKHFYILNLMIEAQKRIQAQCPKPPELAKGGFLNDPKVFEKNSPHDFMIPIKEGDKVSRVLEEQARKSPNEAITITINGEDYGE